MAGALQQRLAQVAREYELEVLREKMDWMRRVEEAEDAGKFLKERAAQQAQLLEEYANEVRMAKQEAQLAQRQAQAYLQELEQCKQQSQAQPALVSQLNRTVVALKFQLAAQQQVMRKAGFSQKLKSGGVAKGDLNKENTSPNLSSNQLAKTAEGDEEDTSLLSAAAFIQMAHEGRLEALRRTLQPHRAPPDSCPSSASEADQPTPEELYLEVVSAALVAACSSRHLACAELLLQAGASVTAAGVDGRTALHAAAAAGDGEMVALLLQQAGASVNALDAVHCTPLQDAVKGGHAELAVKFLREGADPNFRNKEGKCALDIALELEQASQRQADAHMGDDGARLSGEAPLPTRASATAQSVALVLQDKDLQFCNCTVRACAALREARDADALDACSAALELATECSRPVPATDRAHLHYNKAQAACRLEQHSVAVEACHEALQLDPHHARALALRAEIHMLLMEYDDACQDYTRLAEIDPRDPGWISKAKEAKSKNTTNHYQILEIQLGASENEIKKAFREQCKKWHPDRQQNSSPDDQRRATTQFKRVNEAYQILSDSTKRLMYDLELERQGKSPFRGAKGGRGGAGDTHAHAARQSYSDHSSHSHTKSHSRSQSRSTASPPTSRSWSDTAWARGYPANPNPPRGAAPPPREAYPGTPEGGAGGGQGGGSGPNGTPTSEERAAGAAAAAARRWREELMREIRRRESQVDAMVADLKRRSEELGRKAEATGTSASPEAGSENGEGSPERDTNMGMDSPPPRHPSYHPRPFMGRDAGLPRRTAPHGYAAGGAPAYSGDEDLFTGSMGGIGQQGVGGGNADAKASAAAVWCGICGSTEHRSADCDCWAQWGAEANSHDGAMSEDGVEGLSSDTSDDSGLEDGEWRDGLSGSGRM